MSLSTNTLARILEQQKEQERLDALRTQNYLKMAQERAEREAEERALEAKHGGREALAKWRAENAEKIRKEAQEKAEKARVAAEEKRAVDQLAELQAELAKLADAPGGRSVSVSDMNLNKGVIKAQFRLTDRDLELLPKNVVMKEGAKKASSITWNGKDIVAKAIEKFGAREMRKCLAASHPAIARQYIADEMALLETRAPGLKAKARAEAVERLRAADAAAAQEVEQLSEALKKAIAALDAGHTRQRRARQALLSFATHAELESLQLPPIEADMDMDLGETSAAGASSSTPITGLGAGAKKPKLSALSGGKAKMPALSVD